MQHTKQDVYGTRRWYVSQTRLVQLIGVGGKKVNAGVLSGLRYHQLPKAASNSPNASEGHIAMDGANLISTA